MLLTRLNIRGQTRINTPRPVRSNILHLTGFYSTVSAWLHDRVRVHINTAVPTVFVWPEHAPFVWRFLPVLIRGNAAGESSSAMWPPATIMELPSTAMRHEHKSELVVACIRFDQTATHACFTCRPVMSVCPSAGIYGHRTSLETQPRHDLVPG
jgi:hypothetical protein